MRGRDIQGSKCYNRGDKVKCEPEGPVDIATRSFQVEGRRFRVRVIN
jgi:hypothetical protein